MRLEISNNNGTLYIRVVESASVEDPNTKKKVCRKRIIKNIGPVSKFDDGKPDFIERLKASYKSCTPLIPELDPYLNKTLPKQVYNIKLFEGSDDCVSHPKLIANVLLEKLLSELGLDQLIRSYKNIYGYTFDVYGYIKAMLFGRILNPTSKIATAAQVDDYYEPIVKNASNPFQIYDALDFVYIHKNALFNRAHTSMVEKFGRTTSYIYYDVTNFFFETDIPDEDTEEHQALRKYGVSKEERKLPIVQMGLLMDEQGFPISIEVFPGNTLDHLTLQKSFENSVTPLGNSQSRYIYVCDKGIGKGGNLGYAIAKGNGYLTSQTVRGSTKAEKEWILDKKGYCEESENFKYKSKIITKKVHTPDGVALETSEKVLVYWSKSYFEREKAEKRSFVELIEKLIESPEKFRVSKTQCGLLKKYLKKTVVNTSTGELIDSENLKAQLDMDKLKQDFELMGYYVLITSETNMEDKEIISTYKNLVEIEDQFRVMKSTLDTRPVFVRTNEHIIAHLTVCTLALLMTRLIQRQIKLKTDTEKSSHLYESGLSAERIQKALNKWTVDKIGEVYYRFAGIDDPDLKRILDAFSISIPKKCYKLSELKHLKATIEMSI